MADFYAEIAHLYWRAAAAAHSPEVQVHRARLASHYQEMAALAAEREYGRRDWWGQDRRMKNSNPADAARARLAGVTVLSRTAA